LNPVTACLVNNPKDWSASSYKEYLDLDKTDNVLSCHRNVIDINPATYKKFVEDRISYQRQLAKIKHLVFEEA
jgi:hypothetical protein